MSSEQIKITLPDGTVLDKPIGTTGMQIAEGISCLLYTSDAADE